MSQCQNCITDKSFYVKCWQNPIYKDLKNYFKAYEPVCPLGYTNCVNDPAYIEKYYPDYYKETFHNKDPKEVAKTCQMRYSSTPEDICICYDTEDK